MTIQELEQLIIKEFPELKPYIYYKTSGRRWIEEHLLIGYPEKDLCFADIEVKDNMLEYAYCKMLYFKNKPDFPKGDSYNFTKEYPSESNKEFAIDKLKDHIEDIKLAIDYFKDYNPQEVKDQLKYLGFESLNPQEISFGISVGNTDIMLQIPGNGICFDYSLIIYPSSDVNTYKDYSFKSLDEVLKFLTE